MDFLETIKKLVKTQRDEIAPEDFVGMHFTVAVKHGPEIGTMKSYVVTGIDDDGHLVYCLANHDKEFSALFPGAPVFEEAELYLGEKQLDAVRRAKDTEARRARINIDPEKIRAKINAAASRRMLESAVAEIACQRNPNGRDMIYALIDVYPELTSGPDAENEATQSFLLDLHARLESGEQNGLSPRQYYWVRDIVKRYGQRNRPAA